MIKSQVMRPNSIVSYLLPRIRDILFLLVFATAMAAGWRTINNDGDMPRHLLTGKVIIESHTIPRQEMFSYVYEGRPFITHEWLAGVIYYLAYKGLGLGGVVLVTALLIASSFFVLYTALSQEHEDRFVILIFVLWGVACTYWHWVARPHLFTLFYMAVWLALVDKISRGRKIKLWVLPGLMILWGNTHAEFVAGFLVLAAYMAGWFWDYLFNRQNADPEIIKRLAGISILSFVASLINPFGLQTWTTILSYVDNESLMTTIRETRAPNFARDPSLRVEFILMIASVLILSLKKGAIRSGHAFLLAGFTALAMTASRNIHFYGLVAPFVLAGPASELTRSTIQDKITAAITKIEGQLKGFVWPVAIVLIYLVLLVSGRIGKEYVLDHELFPVDAVQWLENHPQSGQMFNEFVWGGYIVWKLWPGQLDFIDSHTDMTGEATQLYWAVQNLDNGWQDILNRYHVKWVIIPTDSPLSQALIKEGWRILYKDSTAIILREK